MNIEQSTLGLLVQLEQYILKFSNTQTNVKFIYGKKQR